MATCTQCEREISGAPRSVKVVVHAGQHLQRRSAAFCGGACRAIWWSTPEPSFFRGHDEVDLRGPITVLVVHSDGVAAHSKQDGVEQVVMDVNGQPVWQTVGRLVEELHFDDRDALDQWWST